MPDTSGWAYDPEWRAFTTWIDGTQHVVYEETIHVGTWAWADEQGLDIATRERLKANPTPGSYQATEPPDAVA